MKKAIVFSSVNCSPCKMYSGIIQQVQAEGFTVVKYDVDEAPDLTSQYQIRSVPTTIILEDNVEVNRFAGVKSASQFIEILEG